RHAAGLCAPAACRAAIQDVVWQRTWFPESSPRSIAFSPDGRTLASASQDGLISLWQVRDGTLISSFRSPEPTTELAFSGDGLTLACGAASGAIYLWNLTERTWRKLNGQHSGAVRSLCFSPDSRILSSAGDDGAVHVWSTADGQPLHVFGGHRKAVSWTAFAPDDDHLLSAGQDGLLFLWSTVSRSALAVFLDQLGPADTAAVSPVGTTAVTAGRGRPIHVWRLTDGWMLHSIAPEGAEPTSAAFTPDGLAFLVAYSDASACLIRIADGACVKRWETIGQRVAFSPDCSLVAAAGAVPKGVRPYGWIAVYLSPVASTPKYTLQVRGGTGSGTYLEGTRVRISAVAPPNHRFDHWTGDTDHVADIRAASTTVEVLRNTAVSAVFTPIPHVSGDLNGDGELSIDDVSAALRFVVGIQAASARQTQAVDLNRNGQVDVRDVLLMLQLLRER
ncbi:MAG: InlB B-repeat-containing protein, partial [Armatimonadota bacterium]